MGEDSWNIVFWYGVAVLSVTVLLIVVKFKTRGLARAISVVANQNEPLPESTFNDAYESFSSAGKEEWFMDYIRAIRTEYGHEGLKVGHLVWILQKQEQGESYREGIEIPPFEGD